MPLNRLRIGQGPLERVVLAAQRRSESRRAWQPARRVRRGRARPAPLRPAPRTATRAALEPASVSTAMPVSKSKRGQLLLARRASRPAPSSAVGRRSSGAARATGRPRGRWRFACPTRRSSRTCRPRASSSGGSNVRTRKGWRRAPLQPLADDAALERFEIDRDVGKFRHVSEACVGASRTPATVSLRRSLTYHSAARAGVARERSYHLDRLGQMFDPSPVAAPGLLVSARAQLPGNWQVCVLVLSGFPPCVSPSHPPLAARAASQLYDVQNLDPSDDDHLRVDDPGQALLFEVQPIISKFILPWFGAVRRSGPPAWCSFRRCCLPVMPTRISARSTCGRAGRRAAPGALGGGGVHAADRAG